MALGKTTVCSYRSSLSSCRYCGHRCCSRSRRSAGKRVDNKRSKVSNAKKRQQLQEIRRKLKQILSTISNTASVQVGSPGLMLSPLVINECSNNQEHHQKPNYCEVTPDILYETLVTLTKWRCFVGTNQIVSHIWSNYPANRHQQELLDEVKEKLEIAAVVGFVEAVANDSWTLTNPLKSRHLSANQVTLFWQIYADTMKPVVKKSSPVHNQPDIEDGKDNDPGEPMTQYC